MHHSTWLESSIEKCLVWFMDVAAVNKNLIDQLAGQRAREKWKAGLPERGGDSGKKEEGLFHRRHRGRKM